VRIGQKLDIATSADYGGMALSTWSTTADQAPALDLNRSKSATIGTQTVVASADSLGHILFRGSDGTAFRDAARILGSVDGTPGTSDMPGRLTFWTTPDGSVTMSERMRIDSSGNVGIGTTTPGSKLEVAGNIAVNGTSAGNITASGTITGGNIVAKYQDVAEWVPSSQQVAPGTVVVLDPTKSNQVISSSEAYDTRVAGVVSEQPGLALGESGAGKVLVATTGRVIVKVDATRSQIHIGDLLVTSEVPGAAMKSETISVGGVQIHRPGTLIGKALEPLEKGSGKILVLLSLQ
jgi:hypothetical protein